MDGGSSFVKYDQNPIVEHIVKSNRDPKIVFHRDSGLYVMSLYLDENEYGLFTSENLLDWTLIQKIVLGDDWECPDFYPLQVDENKDDIRWVLSGASDRYVIGRFDGQQFEVNAEARRLHYGKNSYASQSFYCLADGDSRRVRLAWNTFDLPGMPFNKSRTIPCEMKLIQPGQCHQVDVKETLVDISFEAACGEGAELHISLFGASILCDLPKGKITCLGETAPIIGDGERVKLRMLIDKTGVELYVNDGEVYFSTGLLVDYNLNRLEIKAANKEVIIEELMISELNSIW